MNNAIRWNIVVFSDTDQALRLFLASQGRRRKGDLSRFVQEAVRSHILKLSANQAKVNNANVGEDELTATVVEAVNWARG